MDLFFIHFDYIFFKSPDILILLVSLGYQLTNNVVSYKFAELKHARKLCIQLKIDLL